MQMELLSGFKTMMHNTFCTLINNKWLFLSWRCLDHWQTSFFLVLARNMDTTAFTELDENLSTFFFFITFPKFRIFQNISIECEGMFESGPKFDWLSCCASGQKT